MRSGALAMLVVVAVGVLALLAVGLARGSSTVYTLGVAPQGPVAKLAPGSRVCQGAVDLPDGATYDRIGIYPDSAGASSSRMRVTVRPAAGGAALASAALAGRFEVAPAPRLTAADVGHQRRHGSVTVCVENAGTSALQLWGTSAVASRTSATLDAQPADFDLSMTFERASRRSLVALLPDIAQRASVLHPQWVSPPAYAILAALLLLGGPALLALALRRAA